MKSIDPQLQTRAGTATKMLAELGLPEALALQRDISVLKEDYVAAATERQSLNADVRSLRDEKKGSEKQLVRFVDAAHVVVDLLRPGGAKPPRVDVYEKWDVYIRSDELASAVRGHGPVGDAIAKKLVEMKDDALSRVGPSARAGRRLAAATERVEHARFKLDIKVREAELMVRLYAPKDSAAKQMLNRRYRKKLSRRPEPMPVTTENPAARKVADGSTGILIPMAEIAGHRAPVSA